MLQIGREKFVTPEVAAQAVRSGDWVDYGFGGGYPELLDKAIGVGAQQFRLSSQKQVVEFYRIYGFTPYGEEYMDHHVPHVEMEATVESIVRAVFSGCRGCDFI